MKKLQELDSKMYAYIRYNGQDKVVLFSVENEKVNDRLHLVVDIMSKEEWEDETSESVSADLSLDINLDEMTFEDITDK